MVLKKLLLHIFLLIVYAWRCIASSPDDLQFHKITTSNGLSHNTVYTIIQDQNGFIWFGTREGLNRFDSEDIITYYHNPKDTQSISSNHITALQVGYSGEIYVGTSAGLNVYRHSKDKFDRIEFAGSDLGSINKVFLSSDSSLFVCSNKGLYVRKQGRGELVCLISNANILDFLEFKKGIFWVSSLQRIWLINSFGETIKQVTEIRKSESETIELSHNISCLYKDSSGDIWLGTKRNGLFKYNEEGDWFWPVLAQHQYNPLEVNIVRSISEDKEGNLWIGTESGLFIYKQKSNTFRRYTQSFGGRKGSLSDKAIYSIYRSREDIMWIGTYFGGVNMVRPKEKGFYVIDADGGEETLSGKAVSQIIEDRKNRIWIATEDGGVNIWNRKSNRFHYLKNQPGKNSLSVDNVHALYEDEDGSVWIGTFLGGVNRYDPDRKIFDVYKGPDSGTSSLANNMVYAIRRDRLGHLWVGTQAGLSLLNEANHTYDPFMPEVFWNKFIYEIYETRQGELWICTNNSDSLFYLNPKDSLVRKYSYTGLQGAMGNNQGVICAFEDSQGTMWFGTVNHGLLKFDDQQKKFTSYTVDDGLANNYVYGILEDSRQNLWVSTNKGLSQFDLKSESFNNYNISHGLPNNQFNFKSAFKDENGWMYFGTINGLCYFHPDSLEQNHVAPEVYFSDLKLFNRSVSVGANSALANSINSTQSIELDYSQNVVTFEYAAINYFSLGNNSYAYYLDGFEEGWNYVGNKKNATYTNLSPGTYTFRVKAANNDGIWSSDVRQIELVVKPPFWRSNWAVLIYVLMLIGFFFLYRAILNYRNREKLAIQLERMEREKITEINRHKINFFTNISHEFKTPLTLIIASIDKFLFNSNANQEYNADYKSIKRNAKRLHFLIEQLMEFRRIESDHAKVNYSHGDIVLFLKDTFNAFNPLFSKKGIKSCFSSNQAAFTAYFDGDKLEKIITNVISNAIKHTSTEGSIDMEVELINDHSEDDHLIKVIVSDTGHGIDPNEIDKIFAPFYQTAKGKVEPSGTGIGLALVKSLIDFLNGSIDVQSDLHRGTFITVSLPLKKEPRQEIVGSIEGNKDLDVEHEFVSNSEGNSERVSEGEARCDLLIVEDNPEILNFLSGHFSTHYNVYTATNGKEAIKKLSKRVPDAIISDVMMPEMNGIEFCSFIKQNIGTSHIPVVLLTAKDAVDSRIEGLDVGADIYMSKPFNLKEIDLRIRNLLNSREKLKSHFLKFASVADMDVPLNNRDQDFLRKLTEIVESHLEDSRFNITTFTHEAGVSRTLLHMKLKKLVNLSASEFVKTIRLQRALQLLEKSQLTVSEIAYKVGFSDPNYFTRSFREKYGATPTEYKHKISAEEVS